MKNPNEKFFRKYILVFKKILIIILIRNFLKKICNKYIENYFEEV